MPSPAAVAANADFCPLARLGNLQFPGRVTLMAEP